MHEDENDLNFKANHTDEHPQSVQRSEGVDDWRKDNSRLTKTITRSSGFVLMEYKYRQLEASSSIRLLLIHPGVTVPDYTITAQELYRNVAEIIAVSLGFSAQLLDAVQHVKELSVWIVGCEPSRVPQWNRLTSNHVKRVSGFDMGPPTALNSNWHLQATSSLGSSSKSHRLATINDEGYLGICGAHFDTISYVSEGDLYVDVLGINLGVVAAFWNSHVRPRFTVLDDSANVSFCKALTTTLTRGHVKTEKSNWERKKFVQPLVFHYRSILPPLNKPPSANDTSRERFEDWCMNQALQLFEIR